MNVSPLSIVDVLSTETVLSTDVELLKLIHHFKSLLVFETFR